MEGTRPRATLTLKSDILKVSEVGLELESPLKLAASAGVKIQCDLLTSLGCQELITRTSASDATVVKAGRFSQQIEFLGVNESIARNIRFKLKEWK